MALEDDLSDGVSLGSSRLVWGVCSEWTGLSMTGEGVVGKSTAALSAVKGAVVGDD